MPTPMPMPCPGAAAMSVPGLFLSLYFKKQFKSLRIIKKDFKWYICNLELFLKYKIKMGPETDMEAAPGHGIGIGIGIGISISISLQNC